MPDQTATAPAIAETIDPDAADPIEAIRENYSHWRATGPILVGGSLAFAAGDPVNDDHPMLTGWIDEQMVEPVTDDARKAAKASRPVVKRD
jgi:hypothetical protein